MISTPIVSGEPGHAPSGQWRVERDDTTGITTWTDRRGRRYQSRPPTRPTTTTVLQQTGASTEPAAPVVNTAVDSDPPPF